MKKKQLKLTPTPTLLREIKVLHYLATRKIFHNYTLREMKGGMIDLTGPQGASKERSAQQVTLKSLPPPLRHGQTILRMCRAKLIVNADRLKL